MLVRGFARSHPRNTVVNPANRLLGGVAPAGRTRQHCYTMTVSYTLHIGYEAIVQAKFLSSDQPFHRGDGQLSIISDSAGWRFLRIEPFVTDWRLKLRYPIGV